MKKIAFILLLIAQTASAQNYSFSHLDEKNGFLSDEVFDIVQDNDGIMWFATPYGVFSYNGIKFKNYTLEDGLCSNSIIKLFKDDKNRIWAVSNKGELSVIKAAKAHSFAINFRLKEIIYPGIIDDIYVDSSDNIYLSRNIGGIYKITDFKKIIQLKKIALNKKKIIIHSFKNHFFMDFYSSNEAKLNKKLFKNDQIFIIPLKKEFSDTYVKKRIFKASNSDYYISIKNTVFQVRNNKIIKTKKFKNEITDIQEDKHKRLWISFMYDGLKVFANLSLDSKNIELLKKQGISKIYLDRDSNIWVASLGHSLYFLDNLDFEIYSAKLPNNFNILRLSSDKDYLYTLNGDKTIWKFNPLNNSFFKIYKNENELSNFKSILVHKKNIYIIGKNYFNLDNKGKIIDKKNTSGIDIAFSPQGNMYLLLYDRIKIINLKTKKLKFINFNNQNLRPICIAFNSETDFWIGTSEGLFRQKKDKSIFWGDKANFFRTRIQDLKIKDSTCYIAVRGKGLAIISNNKTRLITRSKGLSDNFINKIMIAKNGIVWTANKNGLNKIIFNKKNHFKIYNYTIENALPTNNIKDIIKQNNFIYLATNEGLVKFNSQTISLPKSKKNIIIDSLFIASKKIKLKKSIILDSDKKLKIYYRLIAFIEKSKANFSYQIDHLEELPLLHSPLKISNLSVGIHHLYFYSGKNKEKKQLFSLKITQKPPIKDSFLSQVLYLILLISLLYGVAKLSASIIQKKAKEKEKFMLLQHKALKTQINPMFFYHSVETVRQLLLKRKNAQADNYLSDFTLLLRNLIKTSNYNFVPVEQELDSIIIYLSLFEQKYRLNKVYTKFDIQDPKISIPPLLLFSLVDAFMEKADNKLITRIKIKLKKKDENFYCFTNQIIYNQFWNEKNKINEEHIIFIKERINLLNKIYSLSLKIDYKKTEDREKEKITETYHITFPINFRKRNTLKTFKFLFNSLA